MSPPELWSPPYGQRESRHMPTSLVGAANPELMADSESLARDRSIRSHLRWRLEHENKDHSETLVLDELSVSSGIARLDLAVLNGAIHGFEIKSERDSLARLGRQIEYFSEVTDFMTLVIVEQFAEEAQRLIPEWWGLAIARRQHRAVYFEMAQECRPNPKFSVLAFLEFLWRDEAYAVLAERGSVKGLKTANKGRLYMELAQQIPWAELHDAVLRTLRLRVSLGPTFQRT